MNYVWHLKRAEEIEEGKGIVIENVINSKALHFICHKKKFFFPPKESLTLFIYTHTNIKYSHITYISRKIHPPFILGLSSFFLIYESSKISFSTYQTYKFSTHEARSLSFPNRSLITRWKKMKISKCERNGARAIFSNLFCFFFSFTIKIVNILWIIFSNEFRVFNDDVSIYILFQQS